MSRNRAVPLILLVVGAAAAMTMTGCSHDDSEGSADKAINSTPKPDARPIEQPTTPKNMPKGATLMGAPMAKPSGS